MTVLDAYAVIAYLRDEPAAGAVREILRESAALTAVGVAEVTDIVVRLGGVDTEDLALDLAELGLDEAVDVDGALGAAAGRLRARHYHRTDCAISMADAIAAEVARSRHEPLATADPALLTVCHGEGIASIPLPGTDGSVWSPPS